MSLARLIATHDEDALAALANVGIVKRATRDLAAGKAVIESFTEDQAVVTVGENTIRIAAADLTAASCDCSATGICRHIVLAVLALRAAPDSKPAAPQTSAKDEIAAFTEAELRKFAGADWDKAVTLARISGEAVVSDEGLNLSVSLPDIEYTVVFLAGQGLAGSAFKGAKSARRRVTTAAALVARARAGVQPVASLELAAGGGEPVDADTLRRTRAAVAALVSAVFQGGSVIAEDAVFDLSITARAQAAPRLTGLLRLLVRQARQARAHHIAFSEDRFLSDAALTYALTQALMVKPEDSTLTGVIRRTYRPLDTETLIPVGAVKWDIPGGSRGLRLHLFAPEEGVWCSLVQARGAGMDPGFSPESVYGNPLWGLGLMQQVMGSVLRVRGVKAATDNQIAAEGAVATNAGDSAAGLHALQTAGQHFDNWRDLRAELSKRLQMGLRDTGGGAPVMIRPRQIVDAGFDEIAQVYRAQVLDEGGAAIPIRVPVDMGEHFAQLAQAGDRLVGLFCEASVIEGALSLSPVSAYVEGKAGLAIVTLGLDPVSAWPDGGGGILSGLAGLLKQKRATAPVAQTGHVGLRTLCSAARDVTAEVLRFTISEKLAEVQRQARALEQNSITEGMAQLQEAPEPDAALRLAYLLHLTEQHAALRNPA